METSLARRVVFRLHHAQLLRNILTIVGAESFHKLCVAAAFPKALSQIQRLDRPFRASSTSTLYRRACLLWLSDSHGLRSTNLPSTCRYVLAKLLRMVLTARIALLGDELVLVCLLCLLDELLLVLVLGVGGLGVRLCLQCSAVENAVSDTSYQGRVADHLLIRGKDKDEKVWMKRVLR